MPGKRLLVVLLIVAGIVAFFVLDGSQYLDREYLLAHKATLDAFVTSRPVAAALLYVAIYVAATALSLPGAAVLSLAGGAIFGLALGTVLALASATAGATLAFLAARLLLRDWVQQRFGERLEAINRGVSRDGAFYLFALRLVPLFPFFVINLVMALTPIRAWTFLWVSAVGMLPGALLYVYAGTQLAEFRLSAGLAVAFVLLGVFPLLAKKVLDIMRARRVYRRWNDVRPKRFDYNMVVIGAGSAGLVASYIAAATKAKVALIEQHRMGGDCLNTGCVPSKALIRSAKLAAQIRRSHEFGVQSEGRPDFAAIMQRIERVIAAIEPHDSVERYSALGVECITGSGRITTPWTVEVATAGGSRVLTTRSIVIAAGARPTVPPIPGLAEMNPLTSDNVWELRELPQRLLVLGGGPIGCELTQAFARLGAQVTQVEMLPRLLIREDADVSAAIARRFEAEGVRVLTGHRAKRFAIDNGQKVLTAEHDGREVRIEFDAVLVAVGRTPNTDGYGLDALGIGLDDKRTIETDETLSTIYPNITVCGDVAGPYQFTHTASHQAWFAAVNALFGNFHRFRADYRVVPWCTFTDPEVARVGINESEARERKIAHEVSVYGIDDLDRAIADGSAHGWVKVLTAPGADKILGATIVGEHAGDLLAEFVLAMKHRIGLNKILGTIHVYPTLAEANKQVAGVWKRSTVTRGQQHFLGELQAWQRGAGSLARTLVALITISRDRRSAYDANGEPADLTADGAR